ncbi:MAG: peptidoglycan DD-metalloendopeptidase family protein [Ignavibacteriales bacterium]|nr:peptidoglycan DD-metalloendopeptidase family protein [Ignavibacteriales bacterium]
MRRPGTHAAVGVLIVLAFFLLSVSVSPLSRPDSGPGDLPDWMDDVYLHFDSLRTDLSDYTWPTDASRTMSSAFGEFRKTHFHAGIDLSTRGRKGYKVFASRSGYVARILVSPVGYGKMLQVRHEDGFTTVYAHLQQFNDEINRYVRDHQYQAERYSVDLRPEPGQFPVEKGAVIAYTGDTGVGPPHFHFEIRDERMNPVNPLLAAGFDEAVTDTRHPEFLQLSFAPFRHTGRVNGTARPVIVDARHRGNHFYTIPQIVRLNGPIGLSVKATDRVNASWHRNGVYHYELYLDSVLIFTSKLDRFSARESEQIALHYDWPMVLAGEGRFQKLYLEPGNRLPLYSRHPEKSGVLETSAFSQGEHELLIVARDIKGNAARLKTTVMFEDPPVLDVRQVDQSYVLVPSARPDLQSITIASKLPGNKRWNLKRLETSRLASTEDGYVLPIDPGDRRIIKVEGNHADGTSSYPVYFAPGVLRETDNSLAIQKEFARDYILMTVSSHLPFSLRPSLWLTNGERKALVDLNATDERTYVGTFPLEAISSEPVRLDANGVVNGASVESFHEFSVFPIIPQDGGVILAGEGEFIAEFPSHGVYQPLYCRVEKTEGGYSLRPHDILLNRGVTVRFRIPAGINTDRSGLFFSHDSELNLLSKRTEGGYFVGKVSRFLGEFSVLEDTVPPSIANVSVRSSHGTLRISFGLHDERSGVDPDKIRMTVDDRLLIGEYSPYHRTVQFSEEFPLQAGVHLLRIESADRLGNSSSVTRSFRVR